MAPVQTSVDPEVFEDLKNAAQACTFLEAVGAPVEFWEALRVAQGDRVFMRNQIAQFAMMGGKSRNTIALPILQRIEGIRRELGPVVGRLRAFLAGMTGSPADGLLEATLAFVFCSAKGAETVNRWLSEPQSGARQAQEKLKSVASIAEVYLVALHPWRPPKPRPPSAAPAAPPALEEAVFEVAEKQKPITMLLNPLETAERLSKALGTTKAAVPPAPPVAAPDPAPLPSPAARAPAAELPPGVDPEVLEDIRCIEECRSILTDHQHKVEPWELFLLVLGGQSASRAGVDDLLALKKSGDAAKLAAGAKALYDKLMGLRMKYGPMVYRLEEFIEALHVGHFGRETMDMAVGFIIGSSRGRERVQAWLADPAGLQQEAAGRFEDVISRVMRYQTALRAVTGR
jgi:hypothetical protein